MIITLTAKTTFIIFIHHTENAVWKTPLQCFGDFYFTRHHKNMAKKHKYYPKESAHKTAIQNIEIAIFIT
jgi:hypothetical protein